jgi:ribosomal protein S18 acetylase RimI-like enzyme
MIRDLLPDDKAVFMEMAKKFYASEAVAHNVDSRILEATFNTAISKSPFLRALIIEDKGIPVGFALLSFSYATEVGGLTVSLEDLYLSEACRGRGLGSKFIRFMEQEYPSVKRFRLEVTKENKKAMKLYCKLGYKIINYVQMVKDI